MNISLELKVLWPMSAVSETCNHALNILELVDILPNVSLTTSEAEPQNHKLEQKIYLKYFLLWVYLYLRQNYRFNRFTPPQKHFFLTKKFLIRCIVPMFFDHHKGIFKIQQVYGVPQFSILLTAEYWPIS